ncbi:MAG: hypothetical protein J6K39_03090 [Clostridia bacterium]|nr:hypothetical protein [Clostridia bacterium]
MVKSYKTHSFVNSFRFSCVNAIKENKIKILVTFALILIAISTGVFVAIKSNANCSLERLQEICLEDFLSGFAASSSAFMSRCFSLLVNVLILTGLSFSPFLFPLAAALFVYRAYLFGLNFSLIFIFYGFGSIFTAVIIILPCQLLSLFALVMYYIVLQKINSNCAKFGGSECNRLAFILIGMLLFVVINLAETLLLCVLNGRVILVI